MAPGTTAMAPRRLRDQHGKYIRAPAAGSKSSARIVGPARGRGLTRSTVATPSRSSSSAASDDEASLDSSRATREPSDTPSCSSGSTDDSVESESVKTESVRAESVKMESVKIESVKMDPSVKLEFGRSDVEQRVKKRQFPSDFEQRVKKRQSPSDVEEPEPSSSTLQTVSAQHRREPTLYVFSPVHEYPIPLKLRSSMTMDIFFASVLGTFGLADRADEVVALKVSLNSLPEGYLTDSWLVRITVPDSFELLLEVISDLPACKKGLPCAIRVDIIFGDTDGDSG